jgi:hypothetical protein
VTTGQATGWTAKFDNIATELVTVYVICGP